MDHGTVLRFQLNLVLFAFHKFLGRFPKAIKTREVKYEKGLETFPMNLFVNDGVFFLLSLGDVISVSSVSITPAT